jgi:NAD+ synthase (glutamine-hydrolysing)
MDIEQNLHEIETFYTKAVTESVELLVLPELGLTGYTIGDYVQQDKLLRNCTRALQRLADMTKNKPTSLVVGLPLAVGHRLYNCAAVLSGGRVLAIVPKSNLPTYSEFYENRWYSTWQGDNTILDLNGQSVLFGTNILVSFDGVLVGVEICEDLWAPNSPHITLTQQGATVIVNPSASPEQVGKATDRRNLVASASYKYYCAYVYAGSDWTESTGEVVMGGHRLHATDGKIVAECQPFENDYELLISDINIDQILSYRRKCKFPLIHGAAVVAARTMAEDNDLTYLHVDRNPFLPDENPDERTERLNTALEIMTFGLIGRLRSTPTKQVTIGVSGGLDSTLALLVACEAFDRLGLPRTDITALVLPGLASSGRTQSNAVKLAEALGVSYQEIAIAEVARDKLLRLGHDGTTQDLGYENAQALQRTDYLYTYCACHGGFLLGTGDLSEIALGWSTYGADQCNGGYNTNAGVPKTMVKALVRYLSEMEKYAAAHDLLLDILDTPISPELTKADSEEITQATEDLVGPYELNDFFLFWHFKGHTRETILALAEIAFHEEYVSGAIASWLDKFIRRFARSQYKRENIPDGPIIGTVSLSPRGCWRAPADNIFPK